MMLSVVVGAKGNAAFDIRLIDNSFTRKWVNELQWHLANCEFNQTEAFASLSSLEDATLMLSGACNTINKYLKGFIETRDDLVNQPQDYFNYLHSKFEKISGGFGKPTRLFSIANAELKDAVRKLNFYTHRVEKKQEPHTGMYISFAKDQYRRQSLNEDDYQYFEFSFPAGTLYSHYVELGKEFVDLYEDDLPIDYVGFSNLHYYGGEATLTFADYDAFKDPDYVKWLVKHGIDPYNKKLGHGRIPLGQVVDLEDAKSKIEEHRYIHSILIKE